MTLLQSHRLLELINALMIAGLLILFLYLFFKKRFFKQIDSFKLFLLTGFFISAATFISLGYLSATYKPQSGYDDGWNYLNEPRYFVFTNFYLQIAFIGGVFLYDFLKKNILQKNLRGKG